jgi:hypothetical protein
MQVIPMKSASRRRSWLKSTTQKVIPKALNAGPKGKRKATLNG